MNLCLQLTNISFGIINASNDFFKQWKEKYPAIVIAATTETKAFQSNMLCSTYAMTSTANHQRNWVPICFGSADA